MSLGRELMHACLSLDKFCFTCPHPPHFNLVGFSREQLSQIVNLEAA
jgi:hypothetical protein